MIFSTGIRKKILLWVLRIYVVGTLLFFMTFFAISSTPIGRWLYEKQLIGVRLENTIPADAIIVLGGGEGGMRALSAAKLYHAGKAPIVIISADEERNLDFLLTAQIPREKIIIDKDAKRTIDHPITIQKVSSITPESSVIVVSSTLQERRAKYLFENAGFKKTQIYSYEYDMKKKHEEDPDYKEPEPPLINVPLTYNVFYSYAAWIKYFILD